MGQAENGRRRPRAVVHRRILDVAESRPDASASAIAGRVSGATADLVEDVLAEYGDPARETPPVDESSEPAPESADDPAESASASTIESPSNDDTADGETTAQLGSTDPTAVAPDATDTADSTDGTDRSNGQMTSDNPGQTGGSTSKQNGEHEPGVTLSEKQRRALRHVHENPDASQADIAADLDVTRATVSRWLNDIPGFEWADREAFAESVFDDDSPQQADEAETAANADADATRRLDDLADRVDRLETDRGGASTTSVDISPDLAHRVVHACMESDRISEDEELELLAAFMGESS